MASVTDSDKDQSQMRRKLLLDSEIANCRRCEGLNEPHVTGSAPGFGSLSSPVVLVGQSLCEKCMETQVPFTGGSGRLIDHALSRAGTPKKNIFITNVVHCHPPGDRKSHDHEIINCSSYLHRELELVQPRLVIALGRDAERVLRFFYPSARNIAWPFVSPRESQSSSAPYLLAAKHPSWINRKHDASLEEEYVACLAAAVTWSFGDAEPVASALVRPEHLEQT
jgi:uracil-DNA glycosylase family 4